MKSSDQPAWTQGIRDRDGRVFPFPSLDFPDSHELNVSEVADKLKITLSTVRQYGQARDLFIIGGAADPSASVTLESYRQFLRRRMTCYYEASPFSPLQLDRILICLTGTLCIQLINRPPTSEERAAAFFFPSLDFPGRSVLALDEISKRLSGKIPNFTAAEIDGSIAGKYFCAIDLGTWEGIQGEYRVPVESYRDSVRRYFLFLRAHIQNLSRESLETWHLEICQHLGISFSQRIK